MDIRPDLDSLRVEIECILVRFKYAHDYLPHLLRLKRAMVGKRTDIHKIIAGIL